MRILIDYRSYQISKFRGIGRYIQGLAEAMIRSWEVDISLLVSDKFECIELSDNILSKKVNIYTLENWDNYIITEPFDFFFKGNFFEYNPNPDYIIPLKVLKKCRSIVGIDHDLIPLIFAGNYLQSEISQKNYTAWLNYLNYSEHIFCNSKCTKNDSVKYLNRSEADFTVIYGGADEKKFKCQNSERKYNSKERTNNLIFISGDDRRKNYHGATRAFAKAYETGKLPVDAKLYLICSVGEGFKNDVQNELKGFKANYGKQIIVTNYISDDEVTELLSNARASIFPSFYEGLGLPIIESYIAGTPAFASNLSSTKEFVNEESSFNPYDEEEFKNVIIRIYKDEEFLNQSLEYGRKVVKNFNWDSSARIVIDKLKELKLKNNFTEKTRKIAVFTILPPKTSGIASYSFKTHTIEQEKYDIFSDIKNEKDYAELLNNDSVNNIFPLEMYDYANFKENYLSKIFVLGNSEHHKEIFHTAIKTKGEPNRYLYLHETFLFWLLQSFGFNNDEFLKSWYPDLTEKINEGISDFYKFAMKYKMYGIRPIINLTGITNIIVNNERAKELIQLELSEEEYNRLNINILFHPIEEIKAEKLNLKENKYQYVIGSFGVPDDTKLTYDIINTVQELNKDNAKYKLIIAGYLADSLKELYNYDFIQIIDSPNTQYLYDLMNSVDLAIQLRPNPHGESSGCIAQLLGLGQNILTSKGFVNSIQEELCHIIEGKPDIQELSNKIEYAVQNKKNYDTQVLINKFSFKNLSSIIYKKSLENV